MAAMSDYLEQQVIDHLLRTGTFGKPAAIYIALFTVNQDDAGTAGTEVSGGSYARVAVTQADAEWNAPGTSGLTDNVNDITFPTATADWGVVTGMAVYDASTGGNLLMHGALASSKTVNNGDTFKFSVGDLDVTFA